MIYNNADSSLNQFIFFSFMQQSYYVGSSRLNFIDGALWHDWDRKAAHIALAEQRAALGRATQTVEVSKLWPDRSLPRARIV